MFEWLLVCGSYDTSLFVFVWGLLAKIGLVVISLNAGLVVVFVWFDCLLCNACWLLALLIGCVFVYGCVLIWLLC